MLHGGVTSGKRFVLELIGAARRCGLPGKAQARSIPVGGFSR